MFAKIAVTAVLASLMLGFAPEPLPTFSNPTAITNLYAPFNPGSVKVFRGRSEGARTAVVESHLTETRFFAFNGEMVEAVVLEEKEFEGGQLVEIARSYLAQDDAGNVRFFGEVSIEYDGGIIVGPEVDSWVVGELMPEDPPGIESVQAPFMYMVANPQVGDSFKLQDFPGASETYTVMKTGLKMKTAAGVYKQVIRIAEKNDLEPGPTESLWVAPGIGSIRERGHKNRNQLLATSLVGTGEPD